MTKAPIKIAVHNGVFHADEVFAIAILRMIYPDVELIRTRDEMELASADFRIDVGGVCCPETGDYDHHLVEGAGFRENGIPYASCGLIWYYFGMKLVQSEYQFNHIDQKIIQSIDAVDNGFSNGEEHLDFKMFNVSDIIDSCNPSWYRDDLTEDAAFNNAVNFAVIILENEIRKAIGFETAKDFVNDAIKNAVDDRYIVLDKYCPWQYIVNENSRILYVVFPSTTGDWLVRTVPKKSGSFNARKPLPRKWAGTRTLDLTAITGVLDAVFCHPACFIAGAKTKEGAIKLTELALND